MFKVHSIELEDLGFAFGGADLMTLAKGGRIEPETVIESQTGKRFQAKEIKGIEFLRVETFPPVKAEKGYLTPRFARVAWKVFAWLWSIACGLYVFVWLLSGLADGSAVAVASSIGLGVGLGLVFLVVGLVSVRMAMEGALILFDMAETLKQIADKEA